MVELIKLISQQLDTKLGKKASKTLKSARKREETIKDTKYEKQGWLQHLGHQGTERSGCICYQEAREDPRQLDGSGTV